MVNPLLLIYVFILWLIFNVISIYFLIVLYALDFWIIYIFIIWNSMVWLIIDILLALICFFLEILIVIIGFIFRKVMLVFLLNIFSLFILNLLICFWEMLLILNFYWLFILVPLKYLPYRRLFLFILVMSIRFIISFTNVHSNFLWDIQLFHLPIFYEFIRVVLLWARSLGKYFLWNWHRRFIRNPQRGLLRIVLVINVVQRYLVLRLCLLNWNKG